MEVQNMEVQITENKENKKVFFKTKDTIPNNMVINQEMPSQSIERKELRKKKQVFLLFGSPYSGKTTMGREVEKLVPDVHYASSGEHYRKNGSTKMDLNAFLEECLSSPKSVLLLDFIKRGADDLEALSRFDHLLEVECVIHLTCRTPEFLIFNRKREREGRNDMSQERIRSFFERSWKMLRDISSYGIDIVPLSLEYQHDELTPPTSKSITMTVNECRKLISLPSSSSHHAVLSKNKRDTLIAEMYDLLQCSGDYKASFQMPCSFLSVNDVDFVFYSDRYVFTEKADGKRMWLMRTSGNVFGIDRKHSVVQFNDEGYKLPHNSLIDGELMEDGRFLCFDCLILEKERVWTIPSIMERFEKLKRALPKYNRIQMKKYREIGDIAILHNSQSKFATDGLIFVPKYCHYCFGYDDLCFKWKPRELLTADMMVENELWECRFEDNEWVKYRQRHDKMTANSKALIQEMEALHRSRSLMTQAELTSYGLQSLKNQEKREFECRFVEHPLRVSFDMKMVEREVEKKNLLISEETKGLRVVTYADNADNTQFINSVRGIVIDSDDKIVSTNVVRFFEKRNFDESENVIASLKLDGSFITFFLHQDELVVCSKRRMDSEQSIWARAYLEGKNVKEKLHKGWNYMAEAMYANNFVTVPHNFNDVVLLSAFDENGKEINPRMIPDIAKSLNLLYTPQFDGPLRHFLHFSEKQKSRAKNTLTNEGMVCLFEDGRRMKIIDPNFKHVAQLSQEVFPLGVWNRMRLGSLESLKRGLICSPHHLVQIENIEKHIESRFNEIITGIKGQSYDISLQYFGNSDKLDGLLNHSFARAGLLNIPGYSYNIRTDIETVEKPESLILEDEIDTTFDSILCSHQKENLKHPNQQEDTYYCTECHKEKNHYLPRTLSRYVKKFENKRNEIVANLLASMCLYQHWREEFVISCNTIFEEIHELVNIPLVTSLFLKRLRESDVLENEGMYDDNVKRCIMLIVVRSVISYPRAMLYVLENEYPMILAMVTEALEAPNGCLTEKHCQFLDICLRELNMGCSLSRTKCSIIPTTYYWHETLKTNLRLFVLDMIKPVSPFTEFDSTITTIYRQTYAKGWKNSALDDGYNFSLARDSLLIVFRNLDIQTLATCRQVCKRWNQWIVGFDSTTAFKQKLNVVQEQKRKEEEEARKAAQSRGRRGSFDD